MTPTATPLVKAATVKRARKAAPAIAAEVVVRMEQTLPWFAVMSPNQRSWVGLVAQAGVASFVEWLAHPAAGHDITGGGFATPPPELARAGTVQQTGELVRIPLGTGEGHRAEPPRPRDEERLHEAGLRHNRGP